MRGHGRRYQYQFLHRISFVNCVSKATLSLLALMTLSPTMNVCRPLFVNAYVFSHHFRMKQPTCSTRNFGHTPTHPCSTCPTNASTEATTVRLLMNRIPNTDDYRSINTSPSTEEFRPETNFGSENVPVAQRPINEYLDVTNQPFFTWARDSQTNSDLLLRFGLFYSIMFTTICYPISGATFTQDGYVLHKLASSNVGAIFVTMLLLLRVYTGYDYIGQRLQSKYIEYEETGWYDGDVEIKTKTELLRDRMLYSSQVQPIVERLRLFVTAGTTYFVGSVILLNVVLTKYPVFDQYDPDVLTRLSYDDKLADSAAVNTNGKPAYCDSRYYRAIANGGLGCN